ncbi:GNAT family N-acetyltransferase [Kitasatospora sp. NPDC059722]|uniref:GNAT family N-acetyltransferase n=1 Tax=Kitasatospora sp. NPDC059722 TaxID=3346925 RepID=UPI0036CB0F0D
MLIDHWPLLGLRLTTPRLELRLPSGEELSELADLAAEGVHDPGRMPFSVPWTDLPPRERARSVVQYHWLRLGNWTPDDWALNLAVFEHGRIVGLQTIAARDFATLREVDTGSWLGLRHQGRGVGTEMRAAVLHLAFAGLEAAEATSGAFADNPSSFRVFRQARLRAGRHRAPHRPRPGHRPAPTAAVPRAVGGAPANRRLDRRTRPVSAPARPDGRDQPLTGRYAWRYS